MQTLKEVPLTDIVLERIFPTRFCGDARQLQSSIQTYGILHPPRLYGNDNTLLVLDGYERLKVAQELGLQSLWCHVYDREHLTAGNAFLLCLELNRHSRNFNLVEKAQLLQTAHKVFTGTTIPKAFWVLVEVTQNIRAMHQLQDLLKLPQTVQKYAVNNSTPLSTILHFLRFKPDEIDKVASQLFILPINQNKLAEIVTMLLDIAKREDKTVYAVLEEILPELELEFSPLQKEQKLRQVLQKRRNPHYEQRLEEFEGRVRKLKFHHNTKVTPAPFFEDDYVEVTTKIRSEEDVQQLIDSLSSGSWTELLK